MKLQGTRLIRRTVVASLDYECVFEVGARRLGLSLCINLDASGPSQILMFEPHRSCNLVPDFEAYGVHDAARIRRRLVYGRGGDRFRSLIA